MRDAGAKLEGINMDPNQYANGGTKENKRAMERNLLNVKRSDRKKNINIREHRVTCKNYADFNCKSSL